MEGRGAYQDPRHECLPDVSDQTKMAGEIDLTPSRRRITSLRLIQPRIDLQQAAQAALAFEQKAFQKAEQKVCRTASDSLIKC